MTKSVRQWTKHQISSWWRAVLIISVFLLVAWTASSVAGDNLLTAVFTCTVTGLLIVELFKGGGVQK